jgi:hypothetical protein
MLAHDELQEKKGGFCGLLVLGEVVLYSLLLLAS